MASTPVPKGHPLMVAWESYVQTPEYAKTKLWAAEYSEDSLWAAFERGWRAALASEKARADRLEKALRDARNSLTEGPTPHGDYKTVDIIDAALAPASSEERAQQEPAHLCTCCGREIARHYLQPPTGGAKEGDRG